MISNHSVLRAETYPITTYYTENSFPTDAPYRPPYKGNKKIRNKYYPIPITTDLVDYREFFSSLSLIQPLGWLMIRVVVEDI